MIKKTYTITVETKNNLNALCTICGVLKANKMEIIDLNILQYPMIEYHKVMIKVESNRLFLNEVIKDLDNCDCILKAGFISEHETINYQLAMFKLETRALLLYPNLQNLLNKFKVEYMDFGEDHFIVEAFGNEEKISKMLGRLIPFGIIEYARSTAGLLKEARVLQYSG